MRRWIIALSIAGVNLVGCATQGVNTTNYTPAVVRDVTNERIVARSHDQVWDEIVRELSKSFFVINNIEKESRIINVSFNSNDPRSFVDCGRTRRTYKQGERSAEVFDYAVAEKSTHKVATQRQEHPAFANYVIVHREPSLEGRSNIYVAPIQNDTSRTLISVNTRYVLNIRVKSQLFAEHVSGALHPRGSPHSESPSFIFNTNKPGRADIGGTTVICIGTGQLESEILKLVR